MVEFDVRIRKYFGVSEGRRPAKSIRKFISFLHKNNIYSKFMYEFAHASSGWKNNYHLSKCYSDNFISNAFSWSDSADGHRYWSNLTDAWRLEQET